MTWTEAEVAALTAYYPEYGRHWEGWSDVLPRRNVNSISKKASALGITQVTNAATVQHVEVGKLDMVAKLFAAGMLPSEIDEANGWESGVAARTIAEAWRRGVRTA